VGIVKEGKVKKDIASRAFLWIEGDCWLCTDAVVTAVEAFGFQGIEGTYACGQNDGRREERYGRVS